MPDNGFKKGYRYTPTVFDAFFMVNGELVFQAKALTDASVEVATTKTEKKAGIGGATLWTILSDRTITVTMTSLDIQAQYIAANLGSTISITKHTFLENKDYRAAEGKITLPAAPADKKVIANIRGNYVTLSVSTTEVDLTAYGITDECVNLTYFYEADGEIIPIPVSSQPAVGHLVLTTPMYESGVEIGQTGWDFTRFQLSGSFTHSTNTSDSTGLEISGTVLRDESSTSCDGTGDRYGVYFVRPYDPETLYVFSNIVVTPTEVEVDTTEHTTEQLTVYGYKSANVDGVELKKEDGVTFKSSADEYATVSEDGLVTAVAAGEAEVTVTYKTLTAKVAVTVTGA